MNPSSSTAVVRNISRLLCRATTSRAPLQRRVTPIHMTATPYHFQRIQPFSSASTSDRGTPTKETLLRVDWLLDHQAPGLLKSRLKPFYDACLDDVVLEDKLYNYNVKSKAALLAHIAKIRMYYRYVSPFNKVERIGSCVYEGEDVVTVLWRLTTLESSFLSYFPSFLTKKEQKLDVSEGALDVHVTEEGYIYKIVNRKITASDREGSKVMEQCKKEAEEARVREQEREVRREVNESFHQNRQ